MLRGRPSTANLRRHRARIESRVVEPAPDLFPRFRIPLHSRRRFAPRQLQQPVDNVTRDRAEKIAGSDDTCIFQHAESRPANYCYIENGCIAKTTDGCGSVRKQTQSRSQILKSSAFRTSHERMSSGRVQFVQVRSLPRRTRLSITTNAVFFSSTHRQLRTDNPRRP